MLKKEILQITELDGQTLLGRLNFIKNELELLRSNYQPKEPSKYIPRKEAAEFFGVSTVTISDWTKKGILQSYKVANRVYYKRKEMEAALIQIKSGKNGQ